MNSDDSQPPSPERSMDFKAGEVLLIDKPLDWTSFDIVNKIRYRLRKVLGIKKIKVGHAGTLDPLATGLLVICTGKSTKMISEIQNQKKEYTGELTMGATTPSYDLETEIDNRYKAGGELTAEDLRFLYEIDDEIEGFGYEKDPRIVTRNVPFWSCIC